MKKLLLTLVVSLGFVLTSLAQKTVSGKVTDANGAPLSNVSVVVKGTTVGTATGSDGSYTINVPANGKTLTFSSLGFDSQDVTIGNRTNVMATLAPAGSKELETVVVTGINRVQKSKFAGAATKIDQKDLEDKPVGSFDQILQGRAPGLISLTGSGAPGTAANVIIRGTTSIEGSSDPLYVVDGIPVEAGVFQGLNPNDFASVDVLRDAASTALYGARASSGVIVITTKRGQAGKLKVSYSGQMGVKSRPDFAFRPMTTSELLKAQEDYGRIVGATASTTVLPGWYYSPENPRYQALSPADQLLADATLDSISKINTNWYDEIFRDGTFSNHQISLSGGTGKTRFYSSLSKYDEQGVTLRTDMERISLRNNLDFSDDKFTLALSSNIGYTKRNFQQSTTTNNLGNPFLVGAVNVPYVKVRNADGSYAVGDPRESKYSAVNTLE
ncbi:MAG: SusC/RagA family TonB-linked outer membrane protein, partial [Chitinophagaceae bacterium]